MMALSIRLIAAASAVAALALLVGNDPAHAQT